MRYYYNLILIFSFFFECVFGFFRAAVLLNDMVAFFEFDSLNVFTLQGIHGFKPDVYCLYHIHEKTVGQDGDCSKTGNHFNPTNINYTLNPPIPNQYNTFEVGDLSGKYGFIHGNELGSIPLKTHADPTLSSWEYDAFHNRSIVIHNCTLTVENLPYLLDESNSKCSRLACANILKQ
jgi:Cu/Zn superoxide dismutase